MEKIDDLNKLDEKAIYNTLESGNYSHLDTMGNIGIFKFKELIVKAISYETNSFIEDEPYRRAWNILYKKNFTFLSDGFKKICYDVFACIYYDLEANIRRRDDIILTLASQYLRGALALKVYELADVIGFNRDTESHTINLGYMETVSQKLSALHRDKLMVKTLGENGYASRKSDEFKDGQNEVINMNTGVLIGTPKMESIVQTGDWIRLPDSPVKKIESVPYDDFELSEAFDSRDTELSIRCSSDWKVLGNSLNSIDSVDDFGQEETMTDKLDLDKEHSDPEIREIVAKEEALMERKLNLDIKAQGTDRAETARLNAQWHVRKSLGLIPADEELPEELNLNKPQDKEMDGVMAKAIKDAYAKKVEDDVSPLDVETNPPAPDVEAQHIKENELDDFEHIEIDPSIFSNGPTSFMPSELLDLNDTVDSHSDKDSLERFTHQYDIEQEEPTMPVEKKASVSKEVVDITTMRELKLERMFDIQNTMVTASNDCVLLYNGYPRDVATGILANASVRNSGECYDTLTLFAHKYYDTRPLVETDLVTLNGGRVILEDSEDYGPKDLCVCMFHGMLTFDVSGLPVLYNTRKHELHVYSQWERCINGAASDEMILELLKEYDNVKLHVWDNSANSCFIDNTVYFQKSLLQNDTACLFTVKPEVVDAINQMDSLLHSLK